jgi:plasmid stabilization system protein ParE
LPTPRRLCWDSHRRQSECITAQANRLLKHPRIGRDGRVRGTRELVITMAPYIVIYRVTERVEILRVLGMAATQGRVKPAVS